MNMAQAQEANRLNDSVNGHLFANETGLTNVAATGHWNNDTNAMQGSGDSSDKTNLPTIITSNTNLPSMSLSDAATFFRQLHQQPGTGFDMSTPSFQQQPEQPQTTKHASTNADTNPAAPSMATTSLVEEDRGMPAAKPKNDLYEIEHQNIPSAGTEICTETKKGGRVSVVPCRARGMSVKHNFQVNVNATFLPVPL
jgi:hypothetical protein